MLVSTYMLTRLVGANEDFSGGGRAGPENGTSEQFSVRVPITPLHNDEWIELFWYGWVDVWTCKWI